MSWGDLELGATLLCVGTPVLCVPWSGVPSLGLVSPAGTCKPFSVLLRSGCILHAGAGCICPPCSHELLLTNKNKRGEL